MLICGLPEIPKIEVSEHLYYLFEREPVQRVYVLTQRSVHHRCAYPKEGYLFNYRFSFEAPMVLVRKGEIFVFVLRKEFEDGLE